MPRTTAQKITSIATKSTSKNSASRSIPRVPAAELLSFLKEIRGVPTWTEKELAKALNIGLAEAKEAVAILQLQGYVERAGRTGKWRVTEEGDLVSGSKSPRFTRQGVEEALTGLHERIKAANEDPDAPYRVTEAIAFGDFLTDAARVQAADVGIRLARKADAEVPTSAKEHRAELAFLKQLRAKTPLLNVQPYEDWMGSRTHRTLL